MLKLTFFYKMKWVFLYLMDRCLDSIWLFSNNSFAFLHIRGICFQFQVLKMHYLIRMTYCCFYARGLWNVGLKSEEILEGLRRNLPDTNRIVCRILELNFSESMILLGVLFKFNAMQIDLPYCSNYIILQSQGGLWQMG